MTIQPASDFSCSSLLQYIGTYSTKSSMSTGCNHSVLHQTKRKHQSGCISRCKPYPVWKRESFLRSPKTPAIVLIVCAPGNLQCKSIEETSTKPPCFLCKPYLAITWPNEFSGLTLQRASSLIRSVENKAYQAYQIFLDLSYSATKAKTTELKKHGCHVLPPVIFPPGRCGVSEFSPCAGPYTRNNDPETKLNRGHRGLKGGNTWWFL